MIRPLSRLITLARCIGFLLYPAVSLMPTAQAQSTGVNELGQLYRQWTQAQSAKAPEQAAWPPAKRDLAQKLIEAVAKGGEAPIPLGELRALFEDFGSKEAFRFTAPAVCGSGARQVEFFVWDWARERASTEEQFDWLAASGCQIPNEAKQSFTRLFAIAKENKVSFARLTVYALAKDDKERERIGLEQTAMPLSLIEKSRIVRIAVAMAQTSSKIAEIPYSDAKSLIELASWDFFGRHYRLPRQQIAGLGAPAQREIDNLYAVLSSCLADAAEAAVAKRRSEYAKSYAAFSVLAGDHVRFEPRALLVALLRDLSAGWDANDCLDVGPMDLVSFETRDALKTLRPLDGPTTGKAQPLVWELFNRCLDGLPAVNLQRLKAGIAETVGTIGCAEAISSVRSEAELKQRLAGLASTTAIGGDKSSNNSGSSLCFRVREGSYAEIINKNLATYRKAASEKKDALVCASARELKTWLTVAGRAFAKYCPNERSPDHPFRADLTRIGAGVDRTLTACR